MEEKIKIKYTSDRQSIVDWVDKALRDAAEKENYEFIGSGILIKTGERDLEFRGQKASLLK